MVMDNEATGKTAIIGRSRRTRPAPRRMVVEVAKTTGPGRITRRPISSRDFAEEVVGKMRGAPRDKWVCRTFPHRLAQDLKEELRDQIREGLIRTEQACLQWLEDEERLDAPNQKLGDLWSIPLPLDRGELRVREWNRYLRKYRRCLKLVEDWTEATEIRHLLKDVLPGHWKRRVEDEEKKRAKKRVAVRIMAAEDTHAGIMEFFRRNLGEPNRMLGLKNAAYVEVFGYSMGQRLLRLNNVEWRRGEPLRMQVIFARMSLDEIVKYITGSSGPEVRGCRSSSLFRRPGMSSTKWRRLSTTCCCFCRASSRFSRYRA